MIKDRDSTSHLPPDPLADSGVFAELLRQAPRHHDVPEDAAARAKAALRAQWHRDLKRRSRRRQALATGAALAATLLLALGLGLLPRRGTSGTSLPGTVVVTLESVTGTVRQAPGGTPLAPGDSLAAGAELETGTRGRAGLRLAGGGMLRLDRETRLRWVAARVVHLERGAVYFDSGATGAGAGAAAAIEVRTALGAVRDVGTQFEVRLERRSLRLWVRDGRAVLERPQGSLAVVAGEEMTMSFDGQVERHPIDVWGAGWHWILEVAPGIDLADQPLDVFLDWVARETGWQVRFADERTALDASKIKLFGSTAGLRPDQAPAVILATCGLKHRLEKGTMIIEPL